MWWKPNVFTNRDCLEAIPITMIILLYYLFVWHLPCFFPSQILTLFNMLPVRLAGGGGEFGVSHVCDTVEEHIKGVLDA